MIILTQQEAETLLGYVEEAKSRMSPWQEEFTRKEAREYAETIETLQWLRVRIENSLGDTVGTGGIVERFEEKLNSMGIEVVTVDSSFPPARNSDGV